MTLDERSRSHNNDVVHKRAPRALRIHHHVGLRCRARRLTGSASRVTANGTGKLQTDDFIPGFC